MDVEVPLTSGTEADGEVVWSWSATLGSSLQVVTRRRRWLESPVTGESAP